MAGRMIDDIAQVFTPEDPRKGVDRIGESIPLKRLGQPEEIVALVAWLLSEECPYAAGGTYTADGDAAAT
jgi:NAD(P)-dependent dehydrogenase (short-subunit alcohol dehydrogenase family)